MRTQKCRTFIAEKAESSLPPHPIYFSLSLPFLSPLTLWILWIFTGAHQGQGHSSVSIPRAISVCSALGVLPLGFSYTANPVTSRNTGQLKTPWNLASSLLTVTLWLQDDLGDSVSGLRSFPIKVSGRNLVQSGNNHKEFSGQQEVSKFVFQLLLREYEHLKKPLIVKIEGFGVFFFCFLSQTGKCMNDCKQDCFLQSSLWKIKERTTPPWRHGFGTMPRAMGQRSLHAVLHLCKVPMITNVYGAQSMCSTITWLNFNTGKT